PTNTTEHLLYDFNMGVGDTVKGYLESFTFPTVDIVQSIDSALVGSTYRKRWNINNCYNIQLIEGIGSTYGLFEPSPGCVPDLPTYSLICFQQNGQTLYPSTTTNCQLIASVNYIDNNLNLINVFPNPAKGAFIIDIKNADIKEIKLSDVLGNIIHQQPAHNKTQIKIDNLQSGTYILTVTDKHNRATFKKIISCP
ncbi:MAG TPA: T9SS type A sorting domain-containing protein, partial [Bacteroidia bacterium]|nr:T9SS type A sorting domain-containing protein [Bacteroidia bacterium]